MKKVVTFPLRVRDRAFAFAMNVCKKQGLAKPRDFDPMKQIVRVEKNPSGSNDYEKCFRVAVWQYLSENLGHGNLPEEVRRRVLGNPITGPSAKVETVVSARPLATAVGSLTNLIFDSAFGIDRTKNPKAYQDLVVIPRGAKGPESLKSVYLNQYAAIASKSIASALLNWIMSLRKEQLLAAALSAGLPDLRSGEWKTPAGLSGINSQEMRRQVADMIYKDFMTRLRGVTLYRAGEGEQLGLL